MYQYEIKKKWIWEVGKNKQEVVERVLFALLCNNFYV